MAIGILGRWKIGIYNRAREKQRRRRASYEEPLFSEDPRAVAEATVASVEAYLSRLGRLEACAPKKLMDDIGMYLRHQRKLARHEPKLLAAEADKYLQKQRRLAKYDSPDDDSCIDSPFAYTKPLTLKRSFGRNMLSEERLQPYSALHFPEYQISVCLHMN